MHHRPPSTHVFSIFRLRGAVGIYRWRALASAALVLGTIAICGSGTNSTVNANEAHETTTNSLSAASFAQAREIMAAIEDLRVDMAKRLAAERAERVKVLSGHDSVWKTSNPQYHGTTWTKVGSWWQARVHIDFEEKRNAFSIPPQVELGVTSFRQQDGAKGDRVAFQVNVATDADGRLLITTKGFDMLLESVAEGAAAPETLVVHWLAYGKPAPAVAASSPSAGGGDIPQVGQ